MSLTPVILDHPLIKHKLRFLRDKDTNCKDFRELVREITMFMLYEATKDMQLQDVEIETPLTKMTAQIIVGKDPVFVPILRAGTGMLDGVMELFPSARFGHIGMYRDHDTHEPVEYYCKLPSDISERDVFVLDPMLATGGSACDAIMQIKKYTQRRIKFMCLVAAPEGLQRLQTEHPDVQVYCAALDERLNDDKYILPGLGDAGDRIFGTK